MEVQEGNNDRERDTDEVAAVTPIPPFWKPLTPKVQGLGQHIYSIQLRDLFAIAALSSGPGVEPENAWRKANEMMALRDIPSRIISGQAIGIPPESKL